MSDPRTPTPSGSGAPRDAVLKIRDDDTGETELHVVRVPEGFSFQIPLEPDDIGFTSVIVSQSDAYRLCDFLRGLDA